jgi:CheY-like chemotaxis protein
VSSEQTNAEGAAVAGRVLYIEDSSINTVLVERILTSRPDVVFGSAPDGRTGLDRATRLHPDLVLLDLTLPDISGEQVLAQLRADPATRAIPVIVVSGDTDPAVHRRVLAHGAQWCLTKPYEVDDLLRLVDSSLGAGHADLPSDAFPSCP